MKSFSVSDFVKLNSVEEASLQAIGAKSLSNIRNTENLSEKKKKNKSKKRKPKREKISELSSSKKKTKKIKLKNMVHTLLPETPKQFALSAESKKYFEHLISKKQSVLVDRDEEELNLIGKLPDPVENLAYLESLGEKVRFHKHTIRHIQVDVEKNIPEVPTVTKGYIDKMLHEKLDGVHRECINGNGCFAFQRWGFRLREMAPPSEHRVWLELRKTSPSTAISAFTMNYLCVICQLREWNMIHLGRLNELNDRDPVAMEDGTVKDPKIMYNLINGWQVHVGVPGEYSIDQCLGLDDVAYTGLFGAVPKFDPKDFIPGQKTVYNEQTKKDVVQRYLRQTDVLLFRE